VLSLRAALHINASNLEACKLMADLASKAGAKDTVFWRKRVAELEPGVAENHIAWATDALRFGDVASADEALKSLSAQSQNTAAYHAAAGALAIATKQFADAEQYFGEAFRLDLQNEVYRLNAETIRLKSTNPETRDGARVAIERISNNPNLRLPALRLLVSDAANRKDMPKVFAFAKDLQ